MTIKCLNCNREFEAKRSTAKYCCDKCRKLAFQDSVLYPEKDANENAKQNAKKTCKYCGKVFTLDDGPLFELMECCHNCVKK